MSELAELLERSVTGLIGPFRAAKKDLEEEAAKASEAVHAISRGLARLRIKTPADKVRLLLVTGGQDVELGDFELSSTGYPIEVQGFGKPTHKPLANKKDISDFFRDLAADPKSTLVERLAYALRDMPSLPPAPGR